MSLGRWPLGFEHLPSTGMPVQRVRPPDSRIRPSRPVETRAFRPRRALSRSGNDRIGQFRRPRLHCRRASRVPLVPRLIALPLAGAAFVRRDLRCAPRLFHRMSLPSLPGQVSASCSCHLSCDALSGFRRARLAFGPSQLHDAAADRIDASGLRVDARCARAIPHRKSDRRPLWDGAGRRIASAKAAPPRAISRVGVAHALWHFMLALPARRKIDTATSSKARRS